MRPLWLRLLVLWLIPLAGPALARPAGSRPRWSPGVVRALAQALGRGNGTQAPATTVAAAALPCVPTRADKRLRKVLLTNKTVACNDGSPAGYVRPIGEAARDRSFPRKVSNVIYSRLKKKILDGLLEIT